MRSKSLLLLAGLLAGQLVLAQQVFVDPKTGNDNNPGTVSAPVKTINEAARRANIDVVHKTTEIILKEGLHVLTETAQFNNLKYTEANRLLIRAERLPDDIDWLPQRMPVILTLAPLVSAIGGEEAKGLQVETNHVTIEGLRFSGSLDYSYKNEKELRRTYPIWREGKTLTDLLVTQCLFAGDPDVLPLHVGVIANGSGLVLDHCVFINCKNTVIFWKAEGGNSRGNAMRYCLAYGCYMSGVWTTEDTNGDDFEFHHNIIANCKKGWIREEGSKQQYSIHDVIFSHNARLTGNGPGPLTNTDDMVNDFLKMEKVFTQGEINIEHDQSKRNYLQLVKDSFGSELKAGLFKK